MSMSMSSLEIKNDVVLGDITELCLRSELHRNWYIKDIQRLFIVPMEMDQHDCSTGTARSLGL